MKHATHRFSIFADYFQFLLMDENCEDDFSTLWSDEALKRMLAVGRAVICPGTLRNVEVAVEVRLVDTGPTVDLSAYDHAAEASIEVPSGKLVVMGCTDYLPDAARLELPPGTYRVLSLANGIDTIKKEWEPANDLYTVYLWPGAHCEPRLLKHWKKDDA
jgi:hypothetical protein